MSVNPSVFRVIDAKWGPHTIDRFASHYNAQVPRFNYKFSSPGCSGVDALALDWRDENNRVCPPVSAIVPSVRALFVDVIIICFNKVALWRYIQAIIQYSP